MTDIFESNHIDKSLSEAEITILKDLYKHYHKNTGVLENLTRDINILMNQSQSLEFV